MFPFGVMAEAGPEATEAAPPATANRLLLHGARHHRRDGAFLEWGQGREGWSWQPVPDWRLDRAAIRAALLLRQRLQLARGDRVALWIPLGVEWAVVERGAWMLSMETVPVGTAWKMERVAAALADSEARVLFAPDRAALARLEEADARPDALETIVVLSGEPDAARRILPHEEFMHYGGVLDTPERASMTRAAARNVSPDTVACLEYAAGETALRPVDQGEMARRMEAAARAYGIEVGGAHLFCDPARPTLASRAALYAGWADGVSRSAFADSPDALANAAALEPRLVVRGSDLAVPGLETAPGGDGPQPAVLLTDGPPRQAVGHVELSKNGNRNAPRKQERSERRI